MEGIRDCSQILQSVFNLFLNSWFRLLRLTSAKSDVSIKTRIYLTTVKTTSTHCSKTTEKAPQYRRLSYFPLEQSPSMLLTAMDIWLPFVLMHILAPSKGNDLNILTLTRFWTAVPTACTGMAKSGIALPSSASSWRITNVETWKWQTRILQISHVLNSN